MKKPTPDVIRKARLAAGLTQQQAAELMGYSRRAWQNWEHGKTEIRPLVYEKFLEMSGNKK